MKLLNSFIIALLVTFSLSYANAQETVNKRLNYSNHKVDQPFVKMGEVDFSLSIDGKLKNQQSVQATTLPYYEDFESTITNGVQSLEDKGWTAIGEGNDIPTNLPLFGIPTENGQTIYASGLSGYHFILFSAKDTWAITPAFELEADQSYTISGWFKTNGDGQGGGPIENITIKVGDAATVAAMTETIYSNDNFQSIGEFGFVSVEFTPEENGEYYFGITTTTANSYICVDDFRIAETNTVAPEADFEIQSENGIELTAVPYGAPLAFVDKSNNNPLYIEVNPFTQLSSEVAYPATSKLYVPFTFTDVPAGTYSVKLTAVNEVNSDDKTIANAYTLQDRATPVPFSEDFSSSQNYLNGSTLTGNWWSLPKRALSDDAYLFSRYFYLESGKSYELSTHMANSTNGTGAFNLIVIDDESYIVGVFSQGEEHNVTSNTNYLSYFEVPVSGNHQIVYQSYNLTGSIWYLGMSLKEGQPSVGIGDVNYPNLHVYTANKTIVVEGVEGNLVTVYSVSGQAVESRIVEDNATFAVNEGLYIVKVGEKATKVVVK